MKKKNLKNLKLNKSNIADLKKNSLTGGATHCSLCAPCDLADTFNTDCPDDSLNGSNCCSNFC